MPSLGVRSPWSDWCMIKKLRDSSIWLNGIFFSFFAISTLSRMQYRVFRFYFLWLPRLYQTKNSNLTVINHLIISIWRFFHNFIFCRFEMAAILNWSFSIFLEFTLKLLLRTNVLNDVTAAAFSVGFFLQMVAEKKTPKMVLLWRH